AARGAAGGGCVEAAAGAALSWAKAASDNTSAARRTGRSLIRGRPEVARVCEQVRLRATIPFQWGTLRARCGRAFAPGFMIDEYNRKELLLALLKAFGSLVCYAIAFAFFYWAFLLSAAVTRPSQLIHWAPWFGAAVLLVITFSGYRTWR